MHKDQGERRTGAFSCLMAAMLLTALFLGLYALTGVTEFSPRLSAQVLLFAGLSLAAGLALLQPVRSVKKDAWNARLIELALYGVYALALLSWLFYLVSQINYITNMLVAIDGTKLSLTFVISVLLIGAAWVLSLMTALLFGKSLRLSTIADTEQEVQHA